MADFRSHVERAVGMHLRPSPQSSQHPDEIAIVDSVMKALRWNPDAARVRAVRNLHRPYRAASSERDWCEHCNRISGGWIAYPCETIQAIGGDE